MPSSYTSSARFTLQATGENNNTWGAILNSGVFQLVDDNINGRLGFNLSGNRVLTSNLGVADEARLAFLDVGGGTGGTITVPAVPKGYFVRSNASGPVTVTAGATSSAIYQTGDAFPCFTDGTTVYGVSLNYQPIRQYIDAGVQSAIDYTNAAISAGNQLLPPAAGNVGKALMVRNVGAPPAAAWIPDTIQQADVAGLPAALAVLTAADVPVAGLNAVQSRAFYGDLF